MTERRHQMIRIVAGDYLLPSNDGETLWRIKSYHEDGSAQYRDQHDRWRTLRGQFWKAGRYRLPLRQIGDDEIDTEEFLDSTQWDWRAYGFRTRAAAIEEALR